MASRCRKAYILPLWFLFSSFFSTPNLWDHLTDFSQTWPNIHLWLLFAKFGPNSPVHLLPPAAGVGKKTELGAPTLNFNNTEHVSATEHNINNRKETCQSTVTPLHAPKFGERWFGNGWERLASFCPPPKFSHWETLPPVPHGRYITDSRQNLARVM